MNNTHRKRNNSVSLFSLPPKKIKNSQKSFCEFYFTKLINYCFTSQDITPHEPVSGQLSA